MAKRVVKKTLKTAISSKKAQKKAKSKKPPKVNISSELQGKFLKRTAFYALFGILTLSLTFLVYFRTKGYTFNTSGEVEHRGIILIDSSPVNSTVFFDDKKIEQTETKIEAKEGDHKISLQASGYRTWQHAFNMRAETVKWYHYPYLIPEQIPQEPFLSAQPAKIYSPKAASKNQLIAIQPLASGIILECLNLSSDPEQALAAISIPADLFSKNSSGTYGQFKFIEWSPDADSLLIEHQFDQTSELINLRINNPEQSSNLTKALAAPISEAHFNPASKLNLLIQGELRQYNPTNLALEQTIASNLTSFSSFEEQTYLYTKTSPSSPESSELYLQQNNATPILITKLNTQDLTQLDYSYTINRRSGYLAISNGINKEIQIFKNPLQNYKTESGQLVAKSAFYLETFNQLKSAQFKISPAGTSQPGRYLALQTSGSSFFIYDFDSEEATSYNLKTTSKSQQITNQNPTEQLDITDFAWLDHHRLQVQDKTGAIYYLDYDGNYLNLISSGASLGLSAFVNSKNYSIIISDSNDGSKTQNLTKLNFKLE